MSEQDPRGPRPGAFYSGVFLLCLTVLMLQIAQTRVLSVVSFYYLAFFSVSMAMFGLTAGALAVYFRPERFSGPRLTGALTATCSAFALSTVVCLLVQLASLASFVPSATVIVVWAKLIVLLAIPFFFAGVAVATALTRSPFPVGFVYGADLTGAAAGCLLVIALLDHVDAPSAVLLTAAVAALAGACFARAEPGGGTAAAEWPRLLRRPGALALVILVLALANAFAAPYGFGPAFSAGNEARRDIEIERWNSLSRVLVSGSYAGPPPLWGPAPAMPPLPPVMQRFMLIDSVAGTIMVPFDGRRESVAFLPYDVTNLAYAARQSGRAAVIGVGSGRDMLSAYLFGFRDVTGIEMNPTFVDLLTDPRALRSYAGLADLPGVRFQVDDGRSWLARTRERFDLIQMSMIDTFAATGAGAFSLSENGLYTVEAWKVFLGRLTPTGVLTVSRWHAPGNIMETGRVVSLALAALMELGVTRPADHLYLAATGQLATVVVGRAPLTPVDLERLDHLAATFRYEVMVRPGAAPVFGDLLTARDRDDLDRRARAYRVDVSAPTDDRPFFFNQLPFTRPGDLLDIVVQIGLRSKFALGADLAVRGNLIAAATLALIVVLSALLVTATVLLPARVAVRATDAGIVRWGSAYFLLIGLGFMFVEMGLLQRTSVFLGSPTYALGVVLFSVILSTGIGSLASEWLRPSGPPGLVGGPVALAVYVAALPAWLPAVLATYEPSSLLVRASISALVITPAGLLMGLWFPTGLRLVSTVDARPMPWFWAVNGAAGVLAAGAAVACSIALSITTTLRIGALCYLLLAPTATLLARHLTTLAPTPPTKNPHHP